MRVYCYWLLADPADAAAIRSIATTGEHTLQEWPHLALRGVDADDVNKLERLARPVGVKGPTGGKLLDRSKITATPFTAVSHVTEAFVSRMATLDEPALAGIGRKLAAAIKDITEEEAFDLLRDMAGFASRSEAEGLQVLQLDVM